MTDQLYLANLPYAMERAEIAEMLGQRVSWPKRIVLFKKGPDVPFRRQSCFVHWVKGEAPGPEELNGWLPVSIQRNHGWTEPLHCSYVKKPVAWQHFGSDEFPHREL